MCSLSIMNLLGYPRIARSFSELRTQQLTIMLHFRVVLEVHFVPKQVVESRQEIRLKIEDLART